MLKPAAVSTAILLAATGSSGAAYFDTGNDYWERCFGKDNITCMATASAYSDMMSSLGYECSTNGVNRTQTKDVLLKFLADHPQDRHWPAASLAFAAYTMAFGCKKPEKR